MCYIETCAAVDMKRVKLAFALILLSAIVILGLVTYRLLKEQAMVDDCLSGQHGSFNYSAMTCDLRENHAFVPYGVRHPYDEAAALFAVVIGVVSITGFGLVGKKTSATNLL